MPISSRLPARRNPNNRSPAFVFLIKESSSFAAFFGCFGLFLLIQLEPRVPSTELAFVCGLSLPILWTLGSTSREPVLQISIASLLLAATVSLLPVGPSRLAVLGMLWVAFSSLSAYRYLEDRNTKHPEPVLLLGLVGLKLLWRPELLVPTPALGSLALDVLVPTAALAISLWLLDQLHPRITVLSGFLIALLVAGGPTQTMTSGMVLLSGVEILRAIHQGTRTYRWLPLALLALGLPWFWQPKLAAVGLIAAALTTLPLVLSLLLFGAALGLSQAIQLPWVTGGVGLQPLWLLPILLPALVHPTLLPLRKTLTGSLLALASVLIFPGLGGLAIAMAWLSLRIDPEQAGARLQTGWLTVLAVLSTLLAALPWATQRPLEATLSRLGFSIGATGALIAVIGFLLLVSIERSGYKLARWTLHLGAGLLACSAITVLPRPLTAPVGGVFQLTVTQPSHSVSLRPSELRAVVVLSALSHSTSLPRDAPVASVEVRNSEGETLESFQLRNGQETGEWSRNILSPPPWHSWIAPSGNRLGRTYRGRWTWTDPLPPATTLHFRRSDHIPKNVTLVIRGIEIAL